VGGQDDGTDVPGSDNEPEELIEFEVDDDGQSSNGERMHPMMEELPGDSRNVKFRKVTVQAEKSTCERPQRSMAEKECLVTYTKVNGHEAWTLWDSGSTATGVTPAFAHIANLRVFSLTNPHVLQLGTIGSRAQISHGADVHVEMPGISTKMYVNVANFDRYDMIIGTPFMREHGVKLDFEKNQITAAGIVMPAMRVTVPDTDDRVRRYRSVDKKRD